MKTRYHKSLNFRTPENFAVIYLKFKNRGQTSEYPVPQISAKNHHFPQVLMRKSLAEYWDYISASCGKYNEKDLKNERC